MEGRKYQNTKAFASGYKRTEHALSTVPWVFKRTNDSKRLFAYAGPINGSVFRAEDFGARNNLELHVTISDNGKCFVNP